MILSREDVLEKLKSAYMMVDRSENIRTQDDQVTSAPRAVRVSMRTAVWMVLWWRIR